MLGEGAPKAGHCSLSRSSDPSAQAHSDLGSQGRTAGGRAGVSPSLHGSYAHQQKASAEVAPQRLFKYRHLYVFLGWFRLQAGNWSPGNIKPEIQGRDCFLLLLFFKLSLNQLPEDLK